MAQIALYIPDIDGECRLLGYERQLEALSIRDTIAAQIRWGNRMSFGRNSGQASFGDIG